MTESPAQTEVRFTAADWATLQTVIPTELKRISDLLAGSIEASKAETAAIRASIVASDARCEVALKAANDRIDAAHTKIDAQNVVIARWSAAGMACAACAAVIWAALKFVFDRG